MVGPTNPILTDSSVTTIRGTQLRASTLLRPGAVLSDRYEVGEVLGAGGMGVVYEAFDRITEEKIALKVVRNDVGFNSELKARFLQEGKISRSLSHENIVRVHDVGVFGEFYYLTMERLWGQSLRYRMEELKAAGQRFSQDEFHSILQQLVAALRYANRTLVHRDLKPENIWIASDGAVKLMDFGIARVCLESKESQLLVGTLSYMSPEQREVPKSVDWRSDQYSLGIILYEMLIGERPILGATRRPQSVFADIPKHVSEAVMKALALRPDQRHPSWDDFKEAFAQRLAGPPSRRLPLGIIAAVAAAAVAGAVLYFNLGEEPPTSRDRQPITDVLPPAPPARQELGSAPSQQQPGQLAAPEKTPDVPSAPAAARRIVVPPAEKLQEAPVKRAPEKLQETPVKRTQETLAQPVQVTPRAPVRPREDAASLANIRKQEQIAREAEARRVEAERQAEIERLQEAERQAQQAQLERERQAAEALEAQKARQAELERQQQEKKSNRPVKGGFLPPAF